MDSEAADSGAGTTDGLGLSESGGILTIRLDRPDKRNAITYDMYVAIAALLERAAQDEEIRCIVLAAAGSIFTAGHDVSGFARGLALAPEEKPSFAFMHALSDFPKPVIAALNGDAVGIGATLLLHCDLVYAVPGCRLVFPFMKMGLIPEFGSTFSLPRLIGHRKSMELFLKDGQCSAERAADWGIVNEVVPVDQLSDTVAGAAGAIAALSPDAVRETKRLLKKHDRAGLDEAILEEAHCFHELLKTEFVREKLGAIQRDISGR
jgi:enoyl-CoA hydratase/carnithine racemase